MIMPSPDSVTFPPASATVSVKAILAFTGLTMGAEDFFVPADGTADAGGPLAPWVAPGYSFLVEHTATGRRVVFDLGMRKDPTTFAPPFIKAEGKVEVKIKNDVAEQIQAGGIELNSVEAVIWRCVGASVYYMDGIFMLPQPVTAILTIPVRLVHPLRAHRILNTLQATQAPSLTRPPWSLDQASRIIYFPDILPNPQASSWRPIFRMSFLFKSTSFQF